MKFSDIKNNLTKNEQDLQALLKSKTSAKFSMKDKNDTIRAAFKAELGTDVITESVAFTNQRTFALISEYISTYQEENLNDVNSFFDFKKIDWGDKRIIEIENPSLFKVYDTAPINIDVPGQPIPQDGQVKVDVAWKVIKIIQPFRDYMNGSTKNIEDFAERVAQSFLRDLKVEVGDKIFAVGATQADSVETFLGSTVDNATAIEEAREHVEMYNTVGNKVVVFGTRRALKDTYGSTFSEDMINELNQNGYVEMIDGMILVPIKQFVDPTSDTAVLPNDKLLFMPVDNSKFIHVLQEGEPVIKPAQMFENANLMQTYTYAISRGMVIATGLNRALVTLV